MKREKQRPLAWWVQILLVLCAVLGLLVLLDWRLVEIARQHETVLELHGRVLPMGDNWQLTLKIGLLVVYLSIAVLLFLPMRRVGRVLGVLLCLFSVQIGIARIGGQQYAEYLMRSGIGTMQSVLDTDYYQSEMQLMGNLGAYAGLFTDENGRSEYYFCRRIDVFGPFAEPILRSNSEQDFEHGHEQLLAYEENGHQYICALSMRQYNDGYWAVVKQMVRAEDLMVEVTTLDELTKFVEQAEFTEHRLGPVQDEATLRREFRNFAASWLR